MMVGSGTHMPELQVKEAHWMRTLQGQFKGLLIEGLQGFGGEVGVGVAVGVLVGVRVGVGVGVMFSSRQGSLR